MCSSIPIIGRRSRRRRCTPRCRSLATSPAPCNASFTEQEAVLLPKLFVKMPHTEIKILLPVQGQHALHYRKRYPPRRRLPGAPVVETVVTIGPVPVIQPPQLPRTQPQYLGGLKPMNLLADGPQNHFLYFHRPLHGDPGVNHPGNLPECGLHPAASQKRTFHMLIKRTYHVLTTEKKARRLSGSGGVNNWINGVNVADVRENWTLLAPICGGRAS